MDMPWWKAVLGFIGFWAFWGLIYSFMVGLESSPGIVQFVGYAGLAYFFWRWFKNSEYGS